MPTATKTRTQITAAGQVRPALKWAGGKRWQLQYVRPLWEPYKARRLVEPFCGGLAIAIGLMPRWAVLNDANPHVINFYQWLKNGFAPTLPLVNDEDTYYQHRARFNELQSNGGRASQEASTLFYYLNRTGYNGLCRFNRSGEFNVPFGRYKTINYTGDFTPYRKVFSRWTFTSGDFTDVKLRPKDFVYADPPYDVPFTSYAKDGFDWDDQVRTAEYLAAHPGPVVLSNQATPRIVRLYRKLGYKLRYLKAPRMISCTGDRTPAREVLATRNLT